MNAPIREQSLKDPVVSDPPLALIQRVESKVDSLKVLPDVAIRALEIAEDPNSSVDEFSKVIQQDVKLAVDVLSIANSAVYSTGEPTANLAQGVVRIGFRRCKNLIIAQSLASVVRKLALEEQWALDVLWQHSLTTGVIAAHLNHSLRAGFDGEEFTSGLVHDFGRMLLAVAFPETFSKFDPLDFEESSSDVLAREDLAIGSNHCEVGLWCARDQGLPDILHEVIRWHHSPEESVNCLRLVALTATADHMANHVQRVGETEAYDPTENPGPLLLERAGVRDAVQKFQDVADDICARASGDADEFLSLGS